MATMQHDSPSPPPAPPAAEPANPAAPGGVPRSPLVVGAEGGSGVKPPEGAIFQRLDMCARYPYTLKYYIKRTAWKFVQSTIFRLSLKRADGWRRFWLRLFGAKIHDTAIIKRSVTILVPWELEMDAYSCLAEGVETWGPGKIRIGRHTVLSRDVFLCTGTHDYTKADLPQLTQPIEIGSGVWVGAQAWIGGGVTLGDNCVVGARAMVNASVKPNMIAVGNPARMFMVRPMEWDPKFMNVPEPAQ